MYIVIIALLILAVWVVLALLSKPITPEGHDAIDLAARHMGMFVKDGGWSFSLAPVSWSRPKGAHEVVGEVAHATYTQQFWGGRSAGYAVSATDLMVLATKGDQVVDVLALSPSVTVKQIHRARRELEKLTGQPVAITTARWHRAPPAAA